MRWIVLLAAVTACSGAPRPAAWQVVAGEPALYLYPERIEEYAPGDPGGYVVYPPAGATAADRAALIAALDPADPDDIIGDGIVMRLDAAAKGRLGARVEILQPAARRAARHDPADVRIDLFAGTADAERDAVARWLEGRGATVSWRGPAALRAKVPEAVIEEVARLGPVRWVE